MNDLALPPRLLASLARVGVASVEVTGTAEVRARLRAAIAGKLQESEAEGLAVELDELAEMLAPGR